MSTIFRASILLIGCLAGQALALDPTQAVGSYLSTQFAKKDGLPSSIVNVILQTRNGFLWVGTGGGLARFDGRHFTTAEFSPEVQPEGLSHALAEGPDGDLWAATVTGALRIPSTALDQFGRLPATVYHAGTGPGDTITVLQFSGDGILWAGTGRGLYRLERGAFSLVLPDVSVSRIERASNGRLLIITSAGFFEWDGARLVDHRDIAARLGVSANQIFHVMEDHTGARWYCTDAGVAREVNGSIVRLQPYGIHVGLSAYRAYEDAQGNVWLNLAGGLYRATAARYEPVPGARARYIYADSEGDLWLGTNGDGLVRLKNRIGRTFTTEDGLHSNAALTVVDGGGGKLWIGTNCGGLALFDAHAFRTYSHQDGLTNACVFAVATDRNNDVWAGTYGGGLFRFRDGRFTQFSKADGLPADVVLSILTARDGTLWLVTPYGISHMQGGHFRNYTSAAGLSSNHILGLFQDRRGVIWAGTPAGINRFSGDRFVAIAQVPGAHDYRILGEDAFGGLYATAAPEGIFRVDGDRLIGVTNRLKVWGMALYQGKLWFCGEGISRAEPDALQRWEHDRDAPLDYAHFGLGDGLMSTECSNSSANLAVTSDGKLWAAMLQGLTMLDLSRMPRNHRKPAIYMEQIMVGRTLQSPGRELILLPGPHHVELHFGVIELASPEKIHMQYRLDDVDQDWIDADENTGAIYPSFPAGTHKFHIRACNSDGVWDRTGIVYNINQMPYYYETKMFRFMLVAMFGLLLAAAYHLRMRRLTAEMNARLDERVTERTRLARDLHDTLIQTIHGSKMVADAGLDDRHDASRLYQALERVSSCLSQATEEGRAALTALRSSATQRNDLAEALARAGQDCILRSSMTFALTVKGTAREMHPIVRDEVYRIAYEAMRNACSHSRGTELNVELTYARDLTVAVRDNGTGFDEERVVEGKAGHFGVRGMRERAERIGAKLHFDSTRSGTRVELIVPAKLTFRDGPAEKQSWLKELQRFFDWTDSTRP
jgi:signal transduction histidine kinase/ligand-binding sensor domain-containing protein